MWNLAATTFGRHIPIASVATRHIKGPGGDIELRIYTPKGGDELKPGFLWCHGGGFIVGDLDANDAICRSIARAAGQLWWRCAIGWRRSTTCMPDARIFSRL
jgi:Esterase/lipase